MKHILTTKENVVIFSLSRYDNTDKRILLYLDDNAFSP